MEKKKIFATAELYFGEDKSGPIFRPAINEFAIFTWGPTPEEAAENLFDAFDCHFLDDSYKGIMPKGTEAKADITISFADATRRIEKYRNLGHDSVLRLPTDDEYEKFLKALVAINKTRKNKWTFESERDIPASLVRDIIKIPGRESVKDPRATLNVGKKLAS